MIYFMFLRIFRFIVSYHHTTPPQGSTELCEIQGTQASPTIYVRLQVLSLLNPSAMTPWFDGYITIATAT